jgi:hypothetical protein
VDTFGRATDSFGGSFSADSGKITFPALINNQGASAGLLLQNMGATYSQTVTRLFELGTPNIYYVGGRTQGNANIARVLGPRKIAREFYLTYGDVCQARSNTLHFSVSTGCGDTEVTRASFTAHFVVIVTIGLTVGAADMMINEQLAMIFSSFLYN